MPKYRICYSYFEMRKISNLSYYQLNLIICQNLHLIKKYLTNLLHLYLGLPEKVKEIDGKVMRRELRGMERTTMV